MVGNLTREESTIMEFGARADDDHQTGRRPPQTGRRPPQRGLGIGDHHCGSRAVCVTHVR